ncbi:hypothetical protein D770_08625 [Flammeovirgaceae bacterium 311]|nr:hypothetical protein D770_08625 [Flammeovirgaceae bacterium 311]
MEAHQQPYKEQERVSQLIARTPLVREGDAANQALLSEHALQIKHRGKSRAFSLQYVERLSLEHRKLWLPLIGGAIVASLCLLALLHTFTMPYRLLSGAAIGLLGVWWGYRGSMALVVYEQRNHTDFLLSRVAQPVPVFLAFANRLIRRYPQPLGNYCISLSIQEWQQINLRGNITLAEPRLCLQQEVALYQNAGSSALWVAFDPLRLGNRLQWSLEGQELQGRLSGTIRVQEVSPLS